MIKDNYRIIKAFFKLVEVDKKNFILLFITSLIGHVLSLIFPFLAGQIVDTLITSNYNDAYLFAAIMGICYIFYALFWHLNYQIYAQGFKKYYKTLQNKIINTVGNYDQEFTKKISYGKIISTTNRDVIDLALFSDKVVELITYSIKLIFLYIIFLSINIPIGISVIVITLISIILFNQTNMKIRKHLRGQRKYMDKITDLFSQVLLGLREIKTFNLLPKLNRNFDNVTKKFDYEYMEKRKYWSVRDNGIPLINNLYKIALYFLFIYMVSQKQLVVASLVILISYYENIVTCVKTLMTHSSDIHQILIAIERISNILNYHSPNLIPFGLNENDYIYGNVEFKNVTFHYQKNVDTLKNITFKANPNEITAIVGHNGSGKSTIFNLLLRLYHPDNGRILIDGENILNYSKKIYSSNVSIVNQKPFIFNMSIRANLAMVDSNHKHQIEVCKRVGIHDFIMSLPKGYNTILKDDAFMISGGQKQLISLARTLLSKSEILLLDEITSALDPKAIEHITKLISDLKTDHTIIMITHKPEMMSIADHVIVLDHGKKVGDGTHDVLLKNNSYYQSLMEKEVTK